MGTAPSPAAGARAASELQTYVAPAPAARANMASIPAPNPISRALSPEAGAAAARGGFANVSSGPSPSPAAGAAAARGGFVNQSGTPAMQANMGGGYSASNPFNLAAFFSGNTRDGSPVNTTGGNPVFLNRMGALIQAAVSATGDKPKITYGSRTFDQQVGIWKDSRQGRDYAAARPGNSRHGERADAPEKSFTAMDIGSGPARDWMRDHQSEFGVGWANAAKPGWDAPHFQMLQGTKTAFDQSGVNETTQMAAADAGPAYPTPNMRPGNTAMAFNEEPLQGGSNPIQRVLAMLGNVGNNAAPPDTPQPVAQPATGPNNSIMAALAHTPIMQTIAGATKLVGMLSPPQATAAPMPTQPAPAPVANPMALALNNSTGPLAVSQPVPHMDNAFVNVSSGHNYPVLETPEEIARKKRLLKKKSTPSPAPGIA